jgi:hypothetical protein
MGVTPWPHEVVEVSAWPVVVVVTVVAPDVSVNAHVPPSSMMPFTYPEVVTAFPSTSTDATTMTASGSAVGVGVGVAEGVDADGSGDPEDPLPPFAVHPVSASAISAQAAIVRALHHGVVIVSPACPSRSVGAAQSGYRPAARGRPHNTYRYLP